jgi:hypothetical protein
MVTRSLDWLVLHILLKLAAESSTCRPVVERSDGGYVIINQLDGMRVATWVIRCDSPSKFFLWVLRIVRSRFPYSVLQLWLSSSNYLKDRKWFW